MYQVNVNFNCSVASLADAGLKIEALESAASSAGFKLGMVNLYADTAPDGAGLQTSAPPPPAAAAAAAAEPDKPKRTRAAKSEPAAPPAEPEKQQSTESAEVRPTESAKVSAADNPETGVTVPTVEELRALVAQKIAAGHRATVTELLREYAPGIASPSISSLAEPKRIPFKQALEKLA